MKPTVRMLAGTRHVTVSVIESITLETDTVKRSQKARAAARALDATGLVTRAATPTPTIKSKIDGNGCIGRSRESHVAGHPTMDDMVVQCWMIEVWILAWSHQGQRPVKRWSNAWTWPPNSLAWERAEKPRRR